MGATGRKQKIRELADEFAAARRRWRTRNRFFHSEDERYLSFLIPEGSCVLDLGCGTGDLLAALKPARGVGMDFSAGMIRIARETYPDLEFIEADVEDPAALGSLKCTFDYILLSDTIGSLDDCQRTLALLHRVCRRDTRLVISYYSYLWEPVLKLAESTGMKMKQVEQNYLTTNDLVNFLQLADFDVIARDWRQLVPVSLWGLGRLVNRYLGTLPLLRRLCLRHYVVGRSMLHARPGSGRCSVIIPCRNERGNIEAAVTRLHDLGPETEIIFVEGHSGDGTLEEIHRVREAYSDRDIKVLQQSGIGKADASFTGFDEASGDILMILDADLTVPPEQLVKFRDAIAAGKGEFINGSRLVYPMEEEAMRFLNIVANYGFSLVFTWLLNQRYTDTLCGTKVLRKADYLRLKPLMAEFRERDPFGDFYLIFGSTRLSLRMIEVPVPYNARRYGETQISRFRHGWQLMKMAFYAYRKLKAF